MSTNNDLSKPAAPATAAAAVPAKKSSFSTFTVATLVTVGALGGLAHQYDEENAVAERIVEAVPYLDHTLMPFLRVIDKLREFDVLQPKAVPPPAPRSPSPSPAPSAAVKDMLEVENFNDSQTHAHVEVEAEAEEVPLWQPAEDEEVSVVASERESETAREGEDELQSDVDSAAVVQIVEDAQYQQALLHAATSAASVNAADQDEAAQAVEQLDAAPATAAVDDALVVAAELAHATGALPRVSAEDAMQSALGAGGVGEVLGTVAKNSIALRHELESVLLKDIHTLDAPALRIRITQLAAELFERLSWESIRLSHSVRQVEAELADKYEALMARQRRELEHEVTRLLFERECELNAQADAKADEIAKRFQAELNATIAAQAEGFQATLTQQLQDQARKIHAELQDELNHQVALVRKSHSDALLALQPKVEALQNDLQAFDKVFESTKDAVQQTLQSHAVSSAVLALEIMLFESHYGAQNKVADKLNKLKQLCKDDALVVSLIESLPARVQSDGALSLSELQVRFQVMREEVRKAALAPEAAPKIVGQLVGTALAAISIAPKGYVSGQGTEEVLARAAYLLERGKVKEALKELDGVSGYSKVLMKDWQEFARERLIVDQALRTLKADSVIRHRSFVA